eukprot:scaffold1880_cov207-Alexandrium_tamarense.AAC.8
MDGDGMEDFVSIIEETRQPTTYPRVSFSAPITLHETSDGMSAAALYTRQLRSLYLHDYIAVPPYVHFSATYSDLVMVACLLWFVLRSKLLCRSLQ